MDKFPELETKRLRMRMLTPADAADLYDYFAKDEVTQYYDLASFTEVDQAAALIARWTERYAAGECIRWAITLKDEPGRVVGTCGYGNWLREHSKAEIGYELSPAYWRRGIMSEALEAAMQYGFEAMGLNRIEAFIDPDNDASRGLLEKAGLREEGCMRDYFFEKGRFVDATLYAILKRDRSR